MKSTELGVLKKSEVYFSSPSQTAKNYTTTQSVQGIFSALRAII